MNSTVPLEELILEPLKFGCIQSMSAGVRDIDIKLLTDITTENFAACMTATIYGIKGANTTAYRDVNVPKFPRWIPRRLRNRWTERKTIEIDATPWLLYPDNTIALPALGTPIKYVTFGATNAAQ
jgi:hypothetical protein